MSYDVNEGEELKTIFEPNVKGETKFPMLLISGSITAEPSGTAGMLCYVATIEPVS